MNLHDEKIYIICMCVRLCKFETSHMFKKYNVCLYRWFFLIRLLCKKNNQKKKKKIDYKSLLQFISLRFPKSTYKDKLYIIIQNDFFPF